MINNRQVTSSRSIYSACLGLLFIFFLSSCLVVKKYPPNRPFVFKSEVKLNIKLPGYQKEALHDKLITQLDDSLKNRVVTKLLFRKRLTSPPVYDTSYASHSLVFMKALLKAQGYLNGTATWDSSLKVKKKQYRVTTTFTVTPGILTTIDTISYELRDTTLQRLATRNLRRSELKKGDAFRKEAIAAELDRLIDVFKNNGYYKITRDDIYAQVDTVVAGLINPDIDIFERAKLLAELQKKRGKPTVNIVIKQRAKEIPSHLKKYYLDSITIYPDLSLREDTVTQGFKVDTLHGITILTRKDLFKHKFLVNNSYLYPGALYSQRNYVKTINNFNQLGAWQQSSIDIFANDSLGKLNMNLRLYPAVKHNLNAALEASRNESDVLASNLFGLGVSLGVVNKNVARESVQSSLSGRFGIELGSKDIGIIQTVQTSLNYTLHFPKFILPFKDSSRIKGRISTEGSSLTINGSNTLRKDFYTLQSANISWGYDWTKGRDITRKNRVYLFSYSPINVEYQHVIGTDSLNKLFVDAPNLENAFKDGFIISQNFRFQSIATKGKHTTSIKASAEESGTLLGLFKTLDEEASLFRFVKVSLEYSHTITYKKTAFAFHTFAGLGVPFGQSKDGTKETTLPVTRGFTAGGPNSMRAWRVRQLGPGSAKLYDTLNGQSIDRFGDIQLEGNVEYRFNLFAIGSLKVKSAVFLDMGNIWLRNTGNDPRVEDGVFKLSTLYRDAALAGGSSLRLDFDYFLIRFDWAYQLKDPYHADDGKTGWFHDIRLFDGQFQLGINYPF